MPRFLHIPSRARLARVAAAAMVATLLTLLVGTALVPSVRAQAANPVKFRIAINEGGFDGKTNYTLDVDQGALVELTFVWEQKQHLSDEHLFVLDGYNVETPKLTNDHREVTMSFVADKPGAFRLKCDIDCELHDKLKNATIRVNRAGTGAPAGTAGAAAGSDTRAKSDLVLTSPVEVAAGTAAQLLAKAMDASGAPIAGGKVTLYEVTGYFGTLPQEVVVASAVTQKDGTATLEYGARRAGARELKAYFEGDARNQATSVKTTLTVKDGGQIYHVDPPSSIPGVNRFFVSAVLIAVWGTMFIVAGHVIAIVRAGRQERQQNGEAPR